MTASFVLGIDPGKSFFAATLVHSTGERVWKARQFDTLDDSSSLSLAPCLGACSRMRTYFCGNP
jgi:hypothetical protein